MSDIKKNIVVLFESLVAGDVLLKSTAELIGEVKPPVEVESRVEFELMPNPGEIPAVSVSGLFDSIRPEASISETSKGAD